MNVTRRIAAGYIALILLPAVLLTVHIIALRRLEAINRSNAGENARVALAAVSLIRDRDQIEEQARRYWGTGDPAANDGLKETMVSFESSLHQIEEHQGTAREQAEASRLNQFWTEFNETMSRKAPPARAPSGGSAAGFPEDLSEQLDRLRAQSLTVFDVGMQEMRRQAVEAGRFGARTELISSWIGGAAVAVGVLLALLIVRSISIPLRNLREGTRSMAEGKSYYRLDTSRADELGQIAKDFNTLAERLEDKPEYTGEGKR